MVSLRPATAEDDTFLFELFVESRADEVAAWGWPQPERDAFLRMQHEAQRRHYAVCANAETLVVDVRRGESCNRCGRLIVIESADELRLADVLVSVAHRGQGIGSEVLKLLRGRAKAARKPLRLSVERQNEGARRLYERSGFVTTGATQTHFDMEWREVYAD